MSKTTVPGKFSIRTVRAAFPYLRITCYSDDARIFILNNGSQFGKLIDKGHSFKLMLGRGHNSRDVKNKLLSMYYGYSTRQK